MGACVYYHLQPTTYNLVFLVAKRVYRLSIYVQELHDLALRAPHRSGAIQVNSPGIADEVGVILVGVYTSVIVEIFHHEILARV